MNRHQRLQQLSLIVKLGQEFFFKICFRVGWQVLFAESPIKLSAVSIYYLRADLNPGQQFTPTFFSISRSRPHFCRDVTISFDQPSQAEEQKRTNQTSTNKCRCRQRQPIEHRHQPLQRGRRKRPTGRKHRKRRQTRGWRNSYPETEKARKH